MREINLENWPRAKHFQFFKDWDYPQFSICADVDVTALYPSVKAQGVSMTIAMVYILARAANEIREFRQRIREDCVVEHEVVHPSTTFLTHDDLFSFCTLDYTPDFSIFAPRATEKINFLRENPSIQDPPGRDDLLFMTPIPWVSFTAFMHPLKLYPADSFPRLAWGKFFEQGERLKMPLSVQGHHALMDGLHVGRYYGILQGYLDESVTVLGGV